MAVTAPNSQSFYSCQQCGAVTCDECRSEDMLPGPPRCSHSPVKSDGLENYPEHRKLAAVKDKSQAIGEFLEWAQEAMGLQLCDYGNNGWHPSFKGSVNIMAVHFGIDLKALENEKRAMLDAIRKVNDGGPT